MASMIDGLLGQMRNPNVSQGLLALGGQMLQAGGQGIAPGAALGQGIQAYQQAYRNSQEQEKQARIEAIRQKAMEQITDEDLRLLAQIDPSGQTVAQVLAARAKPTTAAQVPDVIEIAQRYQSDPQFRNFYDNAYRPQTYSGNTPITLQGGGFGIMQTGNKGGQNIIPIPGAPAQYDPNVQAQVAGAEAGARATATSEADKQAKSPAYESFKVAAQNMQESINSTQTGGFMGASGQLSRITDYQKVQQFNNRREQLSTDLRTLFRIPGEGTLSDREQQQYGFQLPDIKNDPQINQQILADLDARIQARLSQGQQQVPAANRRRIYNPATGRIE